MDNVARVFTFAGIHGNQITVDLVNRNIQYFDNQGNLHSLDIMDCETALGIKKAIDEKNESARKLRTFFFNNGVDEVDLKKL